MQGTLSSDDSLFEQSRYLHHWDICPSSWHCNLDRHSPLIPSTHLNTKTANKDRQCNNWLQNAHRKGRYVHEHDITESKRPFAKIESESTEKHMFHKDREENKTCKSQDRHENFTKGRHHFNFQRPEVWYADVHCTNPVIRQNAHNRFIPCLDIMNHSWNPYVSNIEQLSINPTNTMVWHPSNCYSNFSDFPMNMNSAYSCHPQSMQCSQPAYLRQECWSAEVRQFNQPKTDLRTQPLSSANVSFSMVCNGSFGVCDESSEKCRTRFKVEQGNQHCCSGKQADNHYQTHFTCPASRVKYDIEASIHMRIVESDRNTCSSKQNNDDLHIPEFGSFVDYLGN